MLQGNTTSTNNAQSIQALLVQPWRVMCLVTVSTVHSPRPTWTTRVLTQATLSKPAHNHHPVTMQAIVQGPEHCLPQAFQNKSGTDAAQPYFYTVLVYTSA